MQEQGPMAEMEQIAAQSNNGQEKAIEQDIVSTQIPQAERQNLKTDSLAVRESLDTAEVTLTLAEQKIDHIRDRLAALDIPYNHLGERFNAADLNGNVIESLVVEKVQELWLSELIISTLNHLTDKGLYLEKAEVDIRRINLLITGEIVDVLSRSAVPTIKAISLINQVVTTGWRYPDFESKNLPVNRSPEGFRLNNIAIGDYQAPAPEAVAELTELFTQKLEEIMAHPDNQSELAAEQIAAWSYLNLIAIHPYPDGNGRTARALAEYVLLKMGVKDPVIPGVNQNLSRASDNPPEQQAVREAGFTNPEKRQEPAWLEAKIKDYIQNTPIVADPLARSPNLSNYPGVEQAWAIGGVERSHRLEQNRLEFPNPAVLSTLSYMKRAIQQLREVA